MIIPSKFPVFTSFNLHPAEGIYFPIRGTFRRYLRCKDKPNKSKEKENLNPDINPVGYFQLEDDYITSIVIFKDLYQKE